MGQVKSAVRSTICGADQATRRESVNSDKSISNPPMSPPRNGPLISVTKGSITRIGPLETVPECDTNFLPLTPTLASSRLFPPTERPLTTRRKSRLFQSAGFQRSR